MAMMPQKVFLSRRKIDERQPRAKEAKREKRQAIANTLQYNDQDLTSSSKIAIQGKVTTLTGATVAQNLDVFLNNYSDWLQLSLMDDDSKSNTETATEVAVSEGAAVASFKLKHSRGAAFV
jgi:hypothetical protein